MLFEDHHKSVKSSSPEGLRKRLLSGDVLVADGATGTMLMAAGLPPGTPPELWNVKKPEQIFGLHRSYLDAGSQIILTNTFGGNRVRLRKAGLSKQVRKLNLAAVALARKAIGDRYAYVAGDIGPTGEMMVPFGELTYDAAMDAFTEQASILAEGGVDAIWIETMTDLEEARAAVSGALQAVDLPIFCSLSFGAKGRTMMGVSAEQAAKELWPLGLTAIGANCGEGVEIINEILRQMRKVLPGVPLIAKPNAGLPKLVDDQVIYDLGPSDFATHVPDWIASGARIVGACCGSTPAHIAATAKIIRDSFVRRS